jgi:hypothetical protein
MRNSYLKALLSGAIGATALTVLHETARRNLPDAPRADTLGKRSIVKILGFMGKQPPGENTLHKLALVGDLIGNAMYFSAVGRGDKNGRWMRGALLGLSAGLGAVGLPGPMGLGKEPTNRTPQTQAMTVAWYLIGGLAAAAASTIILSNSDDDQ